MNGNLSTVTLDFLWIFDVSRWGVLYITLVYFGLTGSSIAHWFMKQQKNGIEMSSHGNLSFFILDRYTL